MKIKKGVIYDESLPYIITIANRKSNLNFSKTTHSTP